MKAVVIYDSKAGNTRRVVKRFGLPYFHVSEFPDLSDSDVVVFFCPTYGDEELPEEMEDYIVSLDVRDKKFVVCELGNYYGYDDLEFGALKIIKHSLLNLGWEEFGCSLSLDSLPKINWLAFDAWSHQTKKLLSQS